MKQLCERYSRAVANIKKLWSGRQPPPGIDAPPSIPLLRHIINQAYSRAITSPEDLNSYEPFSPEVYGETSFELVCEVIKLTKMTENDVFLDLGSGVGQIVLQVAAKVGCKCYGLEKADIPAKFARSMEEEFVKWMDWYGKSYGEFELIKGDFLDPSFDEILQSATVIFTNNFAFGPKLNHELKLKFANLKDGTKIVSSHEFCPINFRVTSRNMSDIGSIMHVAELSSLKGSVSWTGKQVSYYLHTIDRGKLEKFYLRQKHPDEYKSESSSHSSSSSSDDDSCSDSSSDSGDDHFKSALQRIKLSHSRPGSKKEHLNSDLKSRSGKTPKTAAGHKEDERWRKKRWPQLKSRGHKDSNSSAFSSSAVSSPGIMDVDGLFSSFHHQLEAYMGQLSTPYFQQWIVDAIEKEKMKKNHLQGVITHLESEVAGLSKETVEQMKASMKELGIRKMTPDGLLLGATSIVSQNKQLRKEMTDLEREITALRQQNKAMETMCAHQKGDPKPSFRNSQRRSGEQGGGDNRLKKKQQRELKSERGREKEEMN
ncbi:Histone-lysine N-methyltransferase, H3 lysine-79 specific [Geodia barretti]|nr:Histone-lysine N-methyltransferase, H3 lysine-79 specific [Geodia barretti]